jgi:hypothetical protein
MLIGLVAASGAPVHLAYAGDTPAAAATATPTTVTTEGFTGGSGDGIPGGGPPHFGLQATGHYTSTGQLGVGTYVLVYPITADAAGTISFRRSDGTVLRGTFVLQKQFACRVPYTSGMNCVAARLHGTGDIASAVVSIATVLRYENLSFLMRGTLALRARHGLAIVDSTGTTRAFGGIEHHGDASTTGVVDIQRTPSGAGYWVVNAAGQVHAFGDAHYFGGADDAPYLSGQRVVSMSPTPSGNGYWLFTATGIVLRFGDAGAFGDLRRARLAAPIVDSAATSTGRGYYLVGGDGGVFAFGDARFRGSTGRLRLAQPVIGMVLNGSLGYWLFAADGGVFSFNAVYWGSTGRLHLSSPIVGASAYGPSYLMVGRDGTLYSFSPVTLFGASVVRPSAAPVVAITAIG